MSIKEGEMKVSSLFTDRLWNRVAPIWNAYLEHPFVKGIVDGTLDKEKFKHYMKQDYVYLIEYSRLFALGSAKAPEDRKSTRLNSSHVKISYAVFCLKKKKN